MEIVSAIAAGLSIARIIFQGFRKRGRNPITFEQHSPPELDKVVGSVSRRRGSETVGNSIEVLKDVYLRAPQEIRRFILLLDGNPSPQDSVAHVEGMRGYFRGLMKTILFYYRGSSDITGIIVYSRSYVQSGKVIVMTGGVGEKHAKVKVNLGDFVHSYKDIELVILTNASSEQSIESRRPRVNRSRSASGISKQINSERPSRYIQRTSSSLPRRSQREKSSNQSTEVEPSTTPVYFSSQTTSQSTSSRSLKDQNDAMQRKRTSSSTFSEPANSSSRISRIEVANSRDFSQSGLSERLLISSKQTPVSTGTKNQACSKTQSILNESQTQDSTPNNTGARTRRRQVTGGAVTIVDQTRLSTDSSENETQSQNCSKSAESAGQKDRSRSRRRPATNRKGSSNEADQRKSSSQSTISNCGQPSRRNAVTSAPVDVLKIMTQSQQDCDEIGSSPKHDNVNYQKETYQEHQSRSKKRKVAAPKCSPPRKSAQEEDTSTQAKSKTPEPVPAKRSRSRKK